MQTGEILIYNTPDGAASVTVRLEKENIWLNQYQMADLFQTDRTSLIKHIKNIYKSGELSEAATCAKIAQVQKDEKRTVKRNVEHYNLDLIISVGFRVNSIRRTQYPYTATTAGFDC